jgi:hypothetical protein
MKEFVKTFLKNIYYKLVKLKNLLKRLIFKIPIQNTYVFILSPPFTGSTMLADILSTSRHVSINNYLGTKEGQTLPEVKKLMFDSPDRWDQRIDFNWPYIKSVWLKYWDIKKPILIEKSPANILRAKSISSFFKPSQFIISYRNPYAQCESIIRRNNDTPEYAANFAIFCLKYQKKNIEHFGNECLIIPYESLTERVIDFKKSIVQFLPEIKDISVNHKINAHNKSGKPLNVQNLNNNKIKNLSKSDLEIITNIFKKHGN